MNMACDSHISGFSSSTLKMKVMISWLHDIFVQRVGLFGPIGLLRQTSSFLKSCKSIPYEQSSSICILQFFCSFPSITFQHLFSPNNASWRVLGSFNHNSAWAFVFYYSIFSSFYTFYLFIYIILYQLVTLTQSLASCIIAFKISTSNQILTAENMPYHALSQSALIIGFNGCSLKLLSY